MELEASLNLKALCNFDTDCCTKAKMAHLYIEIQKNNTRFET